MIIDMRCRPPYGYFLESGFYNTDIANMPPAAAKFATPNFARCFGMTCPDSVWQASFDLFLKEMDDAGIERAVVPIRLTAKDKNTANDTLVDLVQMNPYRFIGSAGIDHLDDGAIDKIKKYVVDGPCTAVMMEMGMGDQPVFVDDERVFPIYEYCQTNQIPLMLSFGGFHFPTADHNRSIHVDNVANIFPKLKIALCHGAWPWVTEAVRTAYQQMHVYLSPDIYALNAAGEADYIMAANYMLRDRFMYGSAYPCVDMKGSVDCYLKKIIPEAREAVMGGNALAFLGLK